MFEPADVFDPARTTTRVAQVAALLATTPTTTVSARRVTRAKGYWTFETLCAAVAEVAEAEKTAGVFPTHAQIVAHGFGMAVNMLKRRGMRDRVAAKLGLAIVHARDIWSRDRVVADLAAWCRQHGRYPNSGDDLPPGLASDRGRLWAGEQVALRTAVEDRLGIVLPPMRAPNGAHGTLEGVARLLAPLTRELGRMPTCAEYEAAGLNSAWSAASRGFGIARVAAYLGVEHGRGRQRRGRGEGRRRRR